VSKQTAAKEPKFMLSHVVMGNRLEIYRVTGEGAGRSFSFLGGMNTEAPAVKSKR
jgi:hypothetical protein